jgi:hypothetical protein
MTDVPTIVLEPAAQALVESTATPPFLFQLPPAVGREALEKPQSGDVDVPEVDVEDRIISGGPTGQVRVRVLKPAGHTGPLPRSPEASHPNGSSRATRPSPVPGNRVVTDEFPDQQALMRAITTVRPERRSVAHQPKRKDPP